MDKMYFVDQMKRMQSFFGKAAFTPEKMERIWYYCEALPNHHFNSICITFMDNDQKPGVSDFRAKAKSYLPAPELKDYSIKESMCAECVNVGIVVIKDASGESLAMNCRCGYNPDPALPVYNEDFTKLPAKDVWSMIDVDKMGLKTDSFLDLQNRWKVLLEKSKKHWGINDSEDVSSTQSELNP